MVSSGDERGGEEGFAGWKGSRRVRMEKRAAFLLLGCVGGRRFGAKSIGRMRGWKGNLLTARHSVYTRYKYVKGRVDSGTELEECMNPRQK
jgi:hypothetical protein